MKNQVKSNQFNTPGRWLFMLSAIAAIGWGASACEKQDLDRTFEGPYFVRFTDTTLTFKESYRKPVVIRVHNVGPQLDQPITVTYTVTGTAREGREYTIEGTKGTVVIPAKKSFGEITVKLINNANNILESQTLTFTLTSVQPNTLQVGFGNEGIVGKQVKFVIQDDCLFGGFYTGTSRLGNQNYTAANVEITSTDCKQYTLSNWNLGIFSFDATRAQLTFVDNGDNSLTVPPQGNANLNTTDTLSGTGAWNPRDRKITLNLRLKFPLTNPKRDTTIAFTQTYTPQ
ncbi:hypothetical protein [Spirosoma areae]